jgi:hypothetical protein
MQVDFLARLDEPVRSFVTEVEQSAGIEITVRLSPELNHGGPLGTGNLAIEIEHRRVELLAPTNGYFPNGGVRHELLHVQRFHIAGVPKLVLSDEENWDEPFADALVGLDNAIEHIVIVPLELQLHPERRDHWEIILNRVLLDLTHVPKAELKLACCMHWTFLRHVLPDSTQIKIAKDFLNQTALLESADDFADQFLSMLDCKENMFGLICRIFPDYPSSRVAFEYLNSITGTRQIPFQSYEFGKQ